MKEEERSVDYVKREGEIVRDTKWRRKCRWYRENGVFFFIIIIEIKKRNKKLLNFFILKMHTIFKFIKIFEKWI